MPRRYSSIDKNDFLGVMNGTLKLNEITNNSHNILTNYENPSLYLRLIYSFHRRLKPSALSVFIHFARI